MAYGDQQLKEMGLWKQQQKIKSGEIKVPGYDPKTKGLDKTSDQVLAESKKVHEEGKYLLSTPKGKAAYTPDGKRVAEYDEAYLRRQKPIEEQPLPTEKVPVDTSKQPEPTDTKITTDTKDMTADWQGQFDDMMKKFETAQTDSRKKQDDIFTKLGETANKDMLEKFEETQKSMSEAYESYFDQQSEYLKELQEQPSAVDQLKQFREEQGLPQMEQMLAGVDQTIMTTEGLLANIEEDIRTRTEGLPVSEAAARRLTSMEQKPLTKQMDELLRSRQRVAAGLEAKQQTVGQFMSAQQEEIAKQKEIAQARLGFAGEQAEFKGDMATQSFDLFGKLQDRMTDIHKLQLGAVKDEAEYKSKLAEMGFDFFTQRMAAQQAGIEEGEKFERELIKIQMEKELERANPDVKSVKSIEDRAGNVSQVITYTDGSTEVQSLGQIGAGEKPGTTGAGAQYSFTNNERGKLIATGLSNSEIDQIESDINTHGRAGEGLTTSQQNAVQQIQKGMTTTQAITTLTENKLKDVAIALVKKTTSVWGSKSTDDAKKQIQEKGYITSGGEKVYLSETQITRIVELIDEEYPDDRSFWEALLPWGK